MNVNVVDCRTHDQAFLESFSLFRGDKKVKQVKPDDNGKYLLKNLDTGTYYLEFKSIFESIERQRIDIKKQEAYTVDLCVNYFDHSKDTAACIIDLLAINDSCVLFFESHGCFHHTQDSLMIYRQPDGYEVNYKGKRKTLTPEKLVLIRNFEIELRHGRSFGCTTVDHYAFIFKNDSISIGTDASCSWNGFRFLTKQLFN